MIVRCTSCQTKFKVADEKVSPKGVKVRCSRCQFTFVVKREDALPEWAPANQTPAPLLKPTERLAARSTPPVGAARLRLPTPMLYPSPDVGMAPAPTSPPTSASAAAAPATPMAAPPPVSVTIETFSPPYHQAVEPAQPVRVAAEYPTHPLAAAPQAARQAVAAQQAWPDPVYAVAARGESAGPRGGSGGTVAVVLVVACLLAGGVYFGREPLQRFLNPPRKVESPTDGLVVTSVYPRMVPRADGAPRLVVEGTLANYGSAGRARVRVNALVLEGDQVIARSQAYCGTLLDDRRLARLSPAEVEAAFQPDGTDGSNRHIAQGGRVGFMVVFNAATSGAPLSFDPTRHRLRVEVATAEPAGGR